MMETWALVLLMVWDAIWKGIALWKAGRNRHLVWFICLFVINTVGILPIIYIAWFAKKRKAIQAPVKKKRR